MQTLSDAAGWSVLIPKQNIRPRKEVSEHLAHDVGARLLRALDVKGHERELLNASDEFSGHCLALTLLGSYLIAALVIGAYRALACTFYYSGDFKTARQYAMRGVQLWRSSRVQSPVEELHAPVVLFLCWEALSEWHIGEIALCQAIMAQAISLAKELNDTNALALALWLAGFLAHFERNPVEMDRLASDLSELSTRQDFALWLAAGGVLRGWARSASGDPAEGLWIEDGTEDWRSPSGS